VPEPSSASRETAAETASPQAAAAAPQAESQSRAPATLQARVMALQRTAGNRAVKQMLQRRRAEGRPEPKPNPPWSKKGINNPDYDCVPYPSSKDYHDAKLTWDMLAWQLPDKVTEKSGNCSLVGDAFAEYLEAKGTRHTYNDDGNCISKQLAEDVVAHEGDNKFKGVEEGLLERWRRWEPGIIWYSLADKTREMEIDLIEALKGSIQPAVPGKLTEEEVSNALTYRKNTLAGGLLFGAGTADHIEADSEYGFDTRHVSGTIKIKRTDDGANPNFIDVEEVFTFNYRVHDALDFCPANTLKKDSSEEGSLVYNELLTSLSRLEATGMARDVEFTVSYHRTRTLKNSVAKPKT
jgi:hypothetical protein